MPCEAKVTLRSPTRHLVVSPVPDANGAWVANLELDLEVGPAKLIEGARVPRSDF